ncbi:Uncharacterized protein FKW44_021012 [Caligus rogercresseyi]|uniref:Uncharacterized protein n=1 Tax=Caligus rogercresseyi TaxID=217165 RepID=A0A7T8JV01_CALRO|nr:Uncharacterized protein FKW44_021012 [Caligus rogercresseyi]
MVKKLLFRRRSKDTSKASLLSSGGNSLSRRSEAFDRSLKKDQRRKIVKQLIFSQEESRAVVSHGGDVAEEESNNYESRKLLIRQMQGMIAKEVKASESEYDSWSDLEENFAKVYEPIPLSIGLETWERMSKTDILREVKSPHVRREFEGLPKEEILSQIQKMHKSAAYLSERFGGKKMHDSWSSRASSILKNPESIYVSREEVIKKLDDSSKPVEGGSWSSLASSSTPSGLLHPKDTHPPVYMSRSQLIRKLDPEHSTETEEEEDADNNSSALSVSSSSSSSDVSTVRSAAQVTFLSNDESGGSVSHPCCETCEESSSLDSECEYSETSCSCSSCVSYSDCSCCLSPNEGGDHLPPPPLENLPQPSPPPRADGKDDSEQQQQHRSPPTIPSKNGSRVKQLQSLMESRKSEDSREDEIRRIRNQRLLTKHLKELRLDNTVNDLNTLRRSRVLKELQKYLKTQIDLDALEPENFAQELNVALRRALDSNYEAFSNLNIGRVYVPMNVGENGNHLCYYSDGQKDNHGVEGMGAGGVDYDTFGSIDSLIFEPKSPSHEDIPEEPENEELEESKSEKECCDAEEGLGPGKTTFAERVKLFQSLGSGKTTLQSSSRSKQSVITFSSSSSKSAVATQTSLPGNSVVTSWKEVVSGSSDHPGDTFPETPVDKATVTFSSAPQQEVEKTLCPTCEASICNNSQCAPDSAVTSWNYHPDQNDFSLSPSLSLTFVGGRAAGNRSCDLRQQLKDSFGLNAPPPPPPMPESNPKRATTTQPPVEEEVKIEEDITPEEDSGILSPTPLSQPSSKPTCGGSSHNGEEVVEELIESPEESPEDKVSEKPPLKQPPVLKQDTMIRELKSKVINVL